MSIKELIRLLECQPPDLQVAYRCFSEQRLLEAEDIKVTTKCPPREDGWIEDARPDKPTQTYLLFPGN